MLKSDALEYHIIDNITCFVMLLINSLNYCCQVYNNKLMITKCDTIHYKPTTDSEKQQLLRRMTGSVATSQTGYSLFKHQDNPHLQEQMKLLQRRKTKTFQLRADHATV